MEKIKEFIIDKFHIVFGIMVILVVFIFMMTWSQGNRIDSIQNTTEKTKGLTDSTIKVSSTGTQTNAILTTSINIDKMKLDIQTLKDSLNSQKDSKQLKIIESKIDKINNQLNELLKNK